MTEPAVPELPSVCFVAIATTGPDPFRHQLYEAAVITPSLDEIEGEDGGTELELAWNEWHAWLSVNLSSADADTLRTTRYHERHPLGFAAQEAKITHERNKEVTDPGAFASKLARLTTGRNMVALGDFEELFVRGLLMTNEQCPLYGRTIDVNPLAAGYLAAKGERVEPYNWGWLSDGLASRLGVKLGAIGYDATPLGSAKLAKAIWEVVTG